MSLLLAIENKCRRRESLGSSAVVTKPKRRAPLLKRKALTTGFFDNKGKDDKEKDSSGGLVFGIPLSQCLENDRIARIAAGEIVDVGCLSRSSRHGSRTSFTSLIEPTVAAKTDDGGSCESLSSKGALTGSDSGVLELSDSGGGGPPGEWDAVPAVVRQCIRHLENTGLRTLGVFRVSPSKKRVRQLREDFDCGRETKIGPDQCPHDVAALLKEFFRDLPDPLLCRDLYQAFVHTQKIRNRRLQQEALQHLIQLLPTPNRETLWALLNFLSVVAANSDDQKTEAGDWVPGNKMDSTNLATVFAPNILHCVKPGQRSEVSVERAEERIDVINVVRALLEHTATLFMVPAALLDEVYLHMMDTHPAELDLALSRRADEQCGDEGDPCSEAETFSIEETLTTSTTTTTGTTTSTRKVWTREQCLHQTAGIGGDIGPRPRRSKRPGSRRKEEGRSNSVDSGSSEDPADPRRRSSPMVITASLTIPMSGPFTLNLDDPDIPYIEETPKQPSAPPRRQRQRSISGCSEGGRHGSDSAVGSSATLSGDQAPSSPPSWASSPPASPDSAVTAVSYIPDQQAVLQRVSFTTSSEVRQVSRSNNQETSRSAAAPYTPSITSIGGAVLRSKTADIERMLHISRPDAGMSLSQPSKTSSSISSESKKYTKRRYTDSRHQTRHIPDSDTLAGKTTSSSGSSSSAAMSSSSSLTGAQNQRAGAQPVWKRRELISSAPKDRERYF
ncbi:rho GTPase-activating protein 21-like [Hylaeus anthracinus]|uniref:rho GTPase-activating protein 21-like n=1 Tax=Hylaeus anthracinus TaxID=313031 RepID=UPI0023B99116|nr:rho GTPase-activating protein 21-like [Hylaeus anthracinus]